MLYIPPVVILVFFKFPVREFICKLFLSVCFCISFLFSYVI